MRERESDRYAADCLRLRRDPRQRAVSVALVASGPLQRSQAPNGGSVWQAAGAGARFTIDRTAMGGPLAAGWYDVCVQFEIQHGDVVLPSLRARYVRRSALTDVEWVMPGGARQRRFGMVVMFFEDVESIELLPGVDPVRFSIRNFAVRRVSRFEALRAMVGRPVRTQWRGCATRAVRWGRTTIGRGLKRATDELLADYRKRMLPPGMSEYEMWVRKYDLPGGMDVDAVRALGDGGPLISLLLCARDVPERPLRRCLDSLLGQAWPHWELCVVVVAAPAQRVDGALTEYASRDARIRVIRGGDRGSVGGTPATGLDLARGAFIALLDAGAELRPHALLRVAEAVARDPDLAIVYSDEDRIDAAGRRFDPDFKPDWNPDLLCTHNYLGHLTVIRTALVREAGGLGRGPGRDHDLVLRCSERTSARQIHHIPEILYHGCVPPVRRADVAAHVADPAAVRAVADHLERTQSHATVHAIERFPGRVRVRWPLPNPAPGFSLIIPTRNRVQMLRTCVETILQRSTYPNVELVIVDNRSTDRGALAYLDELGRRDRVRVLRYDAPFNYSAINNWAARQCEGHLLGLINNDVEVISPDWLEEMAGFAVRAATGAVGAMLYYPDNTIQHAGMLLGIYGVAGHVYAGMPRGYPGHAGRALMAQNLSAVTGACLVVRREVFEEVGGLDEQLPVEFNDVDFCLRVRERGYRNVWTPFAELYHHESASRTIDDRAARQARSAGLALMLARWGDVLREDPAYNPNLSLESLAFGLAFPPRGAPPRVAD